MISNRKENLAKFFVAFDGEYTVCAGLEECLKFVRDYKFKATDIDYLRIVLPDYVETEFYDYLAAINMNDIKIYAIPEGKKLFFRV
jgi:nicotinate phosphoribosyltransferase